jgi:hypothetical protein
MWSGFERKIIRMRLYQCQPGRQFDSEREMEEAVHAYVAELGRLGGLDGAAERPRASVRPS